MHICLLTYCTQTASIHLSTLINVFVTKFLSNTYLHHIMDIVMFLSFIRGTYSEENISSKAVHELWYSELTTANQMPPRSTRNFYAI